MRGNSRGQYAFRVLEAYVINIYIDRPNDHKERQINWWSATLINQYNKMI